MSYARALFQERDLRTVTANTRADGEHFLSLAHNLKLQPHVTTVVFERLPDALSALRAGTAKGSMVLATTEPDRQGDIS
jgi:propanol-preferring alcohol dehydrogenase